MPFCNSSEDKLSDAVTPNMALLSVSSHSKQISEVQSTPTRFTLPHRDPRLGDMRSGFRRPWAFLYPHCVLTLAWGVYISKTLSWNPNITAVCCLAWVKSTMTFHWPYNQKSLTSPAAFSLRHKLPLLHFLQSLRTLHLAPNSVVNDTPSVV